MSQHIDPTESLPAGVAGRINPVCDRFEAAWQTGGRPRLEEFLPQAKTADQPWLLRGAAASGGVLSRPERRDAHG